MTLAARRIPILVFALVSLLAAGMVLGEAASPDPESLFEALAFRHIGPVGNRVPAVVGEAGNPLVYYAGAASGGLWKTDDGGVSWKPVFDDQPTAAIGSLAVAPSDPNVVWAGTGETFIRANISIGNGIYRSTDRGETWTHRGLDRTGRIGRIVVHPDDPDVVFAAALGHVYGPQPERGLYRTRDGGATWEQVLFVDENTGAIDVVMDPNNPRILFAATWQIRVWTAGRESGGPGSGLWASRDGGDTWDRLEGKGLPDGPWGKIGLAMSADDSKRVYALIETSSNRDYAPSEPFQGVLWRSDDGGRSWSMVSADNNLMQRPLYYTRAAASPDDADEIHFMAVSHTRSTDGGKSIERVDAGWDHHDIWIDPRDPDRMIVGHDGGVSISNNRGKTWYKPQLPIAQMYHVATDREIPYNVYGNRQDGPSTYGPSNSLTGRTIPIGAWRSVGGCEVGFALPSPKGDGLVWTGCYDGILDLHDRNTGHSRNISVWPTAVESWPGADLPYRWQWTFPMAISHHDPDRVWVGSQFVHETTNQGQSWRVISPDLTTDAPALKARTGGLTLDDAGPTMAPTVFAIAGSPRVEGLIWAGTNDGQLQVTRDGGTSWANVTKGLRGLPPLGTISNVEPSAHADGTAYVTVDRHQEGDTDPYVYRTTDFGASFTRIDGDIPRTLWSYAHCVREDPVRPGLLYLGTENAIWVSFDDGDHWHELRANLPHAPVHWLEIQPHFNDLVVATYGRGFWILDDITPIQQLAAADLKAEVTLLPPRPAYRFHRKAEPFEQPGDPAAGANPDYGATIHFHLGEIPSAEAEADATEADDGQSSDAERTVELAIVDADGEVIRTLDDVPSGPGFHRVVWDLQGDRTPRVKLRTRPDENPHIGFSEDGWRPLADGGRIALLAAPGTYTVRLTLGDTVQEQPLEVRKDPSSTGTVEDIAAQMDLLEDLRGMIAGAAERINEIEWWRKQIDDLEARLADLADDDEPDETSEPDPMARITEMAEALDETLRETEGVFFDLRLTGAGQDSLRWKRLLYARLTYLVWFVGSSDFPPTDSQRAVFEELKAQYDANTEAMTAVRAEVAAFNDALREADLGGLISDGGE